MNYGYRYYLARVCSWALLAMSALGLVFIASTALAGFGTRRVLGIVLLFGGVVGGITCAFIAIHSKAKQTNHEEEIAARTLSHFGKELRKQHINKSAEVMPQKK